jgi:hypothetical protein
MTQLWLVIFTDRRLADLANILFAPAIAAAGYVLARRHQSRVLAMGWGVALLLVPACAMYLHTTYVDPQNAALVLGAVVYATTPRPRLADGLLAGLGLGLSIGSKGLALISVPIIGLVGAVSLLRAHWITRRRAAIGVVAGSAAFIVATASATYLRNYLHFHNPFWPDLRVNVPALGIHWPGQAPWTGEGGGATPLNLNESLPKLLDHLFALPWSVKGMWFDQAVEYGIGVVWIAVPIGIFAFLSVFSVALRRRLGHYMNGEGAPPLGLALILGVMVAGSPALWGPRYHVPHVGLLFAVVAWFTSRPAWERLAEPAVSAIIVTSLMMFWWTPAPSYYTSPARLVELAHASTLEREVSHDLGAPTTLSVGLAREKELGPGKLLVFNEQYSSFPSVFWNNTFSNRVKFIHGGPGFLARAAQAGATWISLSPQDSLIYEARAPGSGWQEVGLLNAYGPGYAFRRVEPPAAAPRPAAPPSVVPIPHVVAPPPPAPRLRP